MEIGDLPLYNQDDDQHHSEPVRRMKREIAETDSLPFVTPGYNHSIRGVLKNAIDHGSRPRGQNVRVGKPAGVLGASPGAVGTAVVQEHLRSILAVLDVPVQGQPEAYLQLWEGMFDENGQIGKASQRSCRGG